MSDHPLTDGITDNMESSQMLEMGNFHSVPMSNTAMSRRSPKKNGSQAGKVVGSRGVGPRHEFMDPKNVVKPSK